MQRHIICLLFSLILPGQLQAENMTWCAYFNWKPWIYLTSQGEHAGILIDQLSLFQQINPSITVTIKFIDNWKRCQAEVASGKISFILGANKTPEREKKFDYLPEPSFLNHSSMLAYSALNNDKIQKIHSLNDLKRYRLAMVRGNSYGDTLDTFIKTLENDQVGEVSSQGQILKLVSIKRYDYFLLPAGTLATTIKKYQQAFPTLSSHQFRVIYEIPRATPVYIVFGKNTGNYEKYAEQWLSTLKAYYSSVDFEEEVRRHQNTDEQPGSKTN